MSLYFSEELKKHLASKNVDKQIVLYDDAKEKSESHEAYAVDTRGLFVIESGYGITSEASLNNLRSNLQKQIAELQAYIDLLDNREINKDLITKIP